MKPKSELLAVEARRAYDGYLRLCIERPDVATYDTARRNLSIKIASQLWDSQDTESSRYVWFVAYMLKIFDDLIRYDVNEEWAEALVTQIEFHRPAIKAIWPAHWSHIFSKELGELVGQVIGEAD